MNTTTVEARELPIRRVIFAVLAALTFLLIGLGSYVRATGAGLACPDWPLCNGRAVPPFTSGVAQEVIHRYLAAFVLLATMLCLYHAYTRRAESPKAWRFSRIVFALLVVQAIFGGLTIFMKLNPWIVMIHLGLGTLFLQLVTAAAIEEPGAVPAREHRGAAKFVLAVLHIAVIQLLLGGYVSASGASLACLQFPMCQDGKFLPDGATASHIIQQTHRIFAYILLACFICSAVMRKRFAWAGVPAARRYMNNALWLVIIQILVGVGNIHMKISPLMSVLHLLIAQLILLMLMLAHKNLKGWSLLYRRSDS